MIHIDSFSGEVAYLTEKQRRDPLTVLACLAASPRVSTWDMDEHRRFPLWKTIKDLQNRGLVTRREGVEYPWIEYDITDAGKEALASRKETDTK
jgi:hypothetical protein